MKSAASNSELLSGIWKTTGPADLVALAKSHGFEIGDLAPDEIQRLLAGILGVSGAQELQDEELDMVVGAGLTSLKEADPTLEQGGKVALLAGDRKTALLTEPDAGRRTAFLLEVSWVSKS